MNLSFKLAKIKSLIKSTLKQIKNDTEKEYIFDKFDFIKNVSFSEKKNFNFLANRTKRTNLIINWVIPNIGIGSGGHLNIFRFIQHLQNKGHLNRIYIVGNNNAHQDNSIVKFIKTHYLNIGDIEAYRGSLELKKSDITFATSWNTAYYVYYDDNTTLKAYFIQDYEPYFYAVSSEYIFAEMTYEFGFYHLCASKWLAQKTIKENFGSYFDLGVDLSKYKIDHTIDRKKNRLFVYLRSNTPRRATEIVLLALQSLKVLNENIEIVFAGEEKITLDIPFKYENLGILHPDDLPKVYNEATIALVGSLTNYSLLPQELMACGCLVIDIDLENNRVVHNKETIVLAGPNPYDIAQKLNYYFLNDKEREKIVEKALNHVSTLDWNTILNQVEQNLLQEFQ